MNKREAFAAACSSAILWISAQAFLEGKVVSAAHDERVAAVLDLMAVASSQIIVAHDYTLMEEILNVPRFATALTYVLVKGPDEERLFIHAKAAHFTVGGVASRQGVYAGKRMIGVLEYRIDAPEKALQIRQTATATAVVTWLCVILVIVSWRRPANDTREWDTCGLTLDPASGDVTGTSLPAGITNLRQIVRPTDFKRLRESWKRALDSNTPDKLVFEATISSKSPFDSPAILISQRHEGGFELELELIRYGDPRAFALLGFVPGLTLLDTRLRVVSGADIYTSWAPHELAWLRKEAVTLEDSAAVTLDMRRSNEPSRVVITKLQAAQSMSYYWVMRFQDQKTSFDV